MQFQMQTLFVLCNTTIYLFTVAPDKVTIEGPTEAKVGDSLNFKCETSNSNPPATVQWVVDGRTVHATFTHSVSGFIQFLSLMGFYDQRENIDLDTQILFCLMISSQTFEGRFVVESSSTFVY